MTKPIHSLLVLLLFGVAICTAETNSIGKKIAPFNLKDFRGKNHSLESFKQEVLVVAFMGTECPLAKLYSPRLQHLHDELSESNVQFVIINSNRHDSITELAAYARRHKLDIPVLKDLGNKVADQFGATRTPEVFVLDKNRVVRYQGRIDDQYGIGYIRDEPTKEFAVNAIKQLIAGQPVSIPSTEAVGCFIGRIRPPQKDSQVTYSNQVARILQKHCVECHRAGEIAPFSLTSYDEVVGWGDTIIEVIDDQRMPPWHADPRHGQFLNARLMTNSEKETLRRWVKAGSPEGDRSKLPEPLKYTSGWQLPQKPDEVIDMRSTPYSVPAEGTVRYQYFRVDPGFKEDKWVKAAELLPGNRAVVHHILAFVMPPNSRGRGSRETTGEFLAAYVPGYRAPVYPEGMAKFIPAGSKILFQMHYTPIGSKQEDLSKLGLVFADASKIKKLVVTQQAVTHRFAIPPNHNNYKVESRSRTAPSNVELLSMMPHMHLRGKAFRYEARFPDGRKEVLLDVPRYDFNWQTSYRLNKPVSLPKGAYIRCVAHFDNSEENLNNPDPSATVRWGDQTWNEMMIGYFDVAIPVDEAGLNPKKPARAESVADRIVGALKRFDADKNNELSIDEVPQRHHPIFKILDTNKDSKVTQEEIDAALEKFRRRNQ